MKAVIIDDEKHCCEVLETFLKKMEGTEHLKSFLNPLEAVKELAQLDFDILFLDIEMPHLNGFELLNVSPDNNWQVIFTTAYDEHALKAFKVNAVDYLLKPIDRHDLSNALSKIEDEQQDFAQQQNVLEAVGNRIKKIAIPTMAGLELIAIDDIYFLEAQKNYTNLVFNDRKHLTSRTLKSYEKLELQYGFIRVHNSYMVNPNRIQRYVKGDGGYLVMENGIQIPVSRSRKDALVSILKML